jgi:hypothetical protein
MWVVSFPPNLDGIHRVEIPEVPTQHVRAAELSRAPWEGALDWHLAPHPLCFVTNARAFLQQVVGDYYLLVDFMGVLKVRSKALSLKGLLAHVANDCSCCLFPCRNAFP